ncbi:hypothetical protein DDJ31_13405 [Streptomyces griseoviridis]|uniref:Core-binding (CB) domain-containing protein n=1 Tax=Streptomyces griseoviridis TaxID=45398 RepID=A0ABX5TW97_STRGD|nr:hypothetical protein DDJ31_13405 [Streptomyces griseoviridis]
MVAEVSALATFFRWLAETCGQVLSTNSTAKSYQLVSAALLEYETGTPVSTLKGSPRLTAVSRSERRASASALVAKVLLCFFVPTFQTTL